MLASRALASNTTGVDDTCIPEEGEELDGKPNEKEGNKDDHFCPYHKTKSHSLYNCKSFNELSFEARKDFLFKNGLCFNCAKSNKHIARMCDNTPPKYRICEKKHLTILHDPTKYDDTVEGSLSSCTQVCDETGMVRSCARIVPVKVFHRSDSSRETLTYAVLDDQSTDVFVSDALLDQLGVEGHRVNLQINTIVGTNTIRTKKVSGLCIQDIGREHSPVKVPPAYARDHIPATQYDIATPESPSNGII